jgi:hypothetical protein
MNAQINVDVLGDIISFLDITEDKSVLTVCKQLCKINDNESNQILRTWENNSKYECKVYDDRKEWWVNGRLHREADLPAVEFIKGMKLWFVNSKLHRENDLPAVVYANGTKEWWMNGLIHRDADRPAIEHANGVKEWWVNGKFYQCT